MWKRGQWRVDAGRAIKVVALLALAYALALRGPAALAASMPGLDPLLGAAHVLCITDGENSSDSGLPLGTSTHTCGECCLSHLRPLVPAASLPPIVVPWPERAWQATEVADHSAPRGPPDEAWSHARTQRGPPRMFEPIHFA